LDRGKRFAGRKAKLRIQAHRPSVVSDLNQSHPQCLSLDASVQHRLHQRAADTCVVHIGSDGDRTNAEDCRAFVEEVAADDPIVRFHDNAEEIRVRLQRRDQLSRGPYRREVRRKVMPSSDRVEGLVADAAAVVDVCLRHGAHANHL